MDNLSKPSVDQLFNPNCEGDDCATTQHFLRQLFLHETELQYFHYELSGNQKKITKILKDLEGIGEYSAEKYFFPGRKWKIVQDCTFWEKIVKISIFWVIIDKICKFRGKK